jgi:outer membrane protein assembly factor BamB
MAAASHFGTSLWEADTKQRPSLRRLLPQKEIFSSVYALRADDGKVLWRLPVNEGKLAITSWLAVEQGVVYAGADLGNADGSTFALRSSDGSLLWAHNGEGQSDWAVVGQGAIYITASSGVVYALQERDGKKLWRYTSGGSVFGPPVLDGARLYVGDDNGVISVLDAGNGSLRAHYTLITGS